MSVVLSLSSEFKDLILNAEQKLIMYVLFGTKMFFY
jgi:hypothetical protein